MSPNLFNLKSGPPKRPCSLCKDEFAEPGKELCLECEAAQERFLADHIKIIEVPVPKPKAFDAAE